MIRLRVSDLDQWVRYIEPEREEFEVSTEDFLAYMRRESVATDDMRCGQAFHTLLEHAGPDSFFDEVEQDGFTFRFGGDFPLALPPEREGSVEKVYTTAAGPVLLRGRVDGLDGFEVTDYKLTTSTFDAERYAGSLQWKAYCDMTGARQFQYLVFQAKRKETDVWVYDLHPLTLHAYPQMTDEVQRRVEQLAQFVAVHVPSLIVDGVPV